MVTTRFAFVARTAVAHLGKAVTPARRPAGYWWRPSRGRRASSRKVSRWAIGFFSDRIWIALDMVLRRHRAVNLDRGEDRESVLGDRGMPSVTRPVSTACAPVSCSDCFVAMSVAAIAAPAKHRQPRRPQPPPMHHRLCAWASLIPSVPRDRRRHPRSAARECGRPLYSGATLVRPSTR